MAGLQAMLFDKPALKHKRGGCPRVDFEAARNPVRHCGNDRSFVGEEEWYTFPSSAVPKISRRSKRQCLVIIGKPDNEATENTKPDKTGERLPIATKAPSARSSRSKYAPPAPRFLS